MREPQITLGRAGCLPNGTSHPALEALELPRTEVCFLKGQQSPLILWASPPGSGDVSLTSIWHFHVVIKNQKTGWDPPLFLKKRETTLSRHWKHQKEPTPIPTLPILLKYLATLAAKGSPFHTKEDLFPPESLLPKEQTETGLGWGKPALCPDWGSGGQVRPIPGKWTLSFQDSRACLRAA